MKYKVGDKVRIKSLDWYNENKNKDGNIRYKHGTAYPIFFTKYMSRFCGETVTIKCVHEKSYYMNETGSCEFWTDEMIEGLVEGENKPKFKVGNEVRIKGTDIGGTIESVIRGQLIVNSKGSKIPAWPEDVVLMKSVEEETKPNIIEEAKTYWDSIKDAWICPEGYIFKDENGNVINATKIVLKKKKKEYPKTYEECCDTLSVCSSEHTSLVAAQLDLPMNTFIRLLVARNAYWKIAGDEMGLGKPWEPDWKNSEMKYTISFEEDEYTPYRTFSVNCPFAFSTEEMRDAFYENFKELIEQCKELL